MTKNEKNTLFFHMTHALHAKEFSAVSYLEHLIFGLGLADECTEYLAKNDSLKESLKEYAKTDLYKMFL